MTAFPFWGRVSTRDGFERGKRHYWFRLSMPQGGIRWRAECGLVASFIRPDAGLHDRCEKCERRQELRLAAKFGRVMA